MFNLPRQVAPISGSVSTAGVPGFNRLSTTATGNIQNMLSGMPSAGPTKRANAYFGAGSGMPGSDFVRNRGYDLYGEKADKYQQEGLDNFLKLLSGYSGTVMPTAGQQIETQQFNANLANRGREFDINEAGQQQQQAFNEMKAGRGVPWDSSARGDVTDRFGAKLGYDTNLDRLKALGRIR